MRPLDAAQVIERLADARERVASGWPSVALALAGPPISTAQARTVEAADAVFASEPVPPWVQVLTESILAVDECRELWGNAPDVIAPSASDWAPCALELRPHLIRARACVETGLAWEDPEGLSRAQGLCVLHLAICLMQWQEAEKRHEAAAAKAQAEIERGRQERAADVARAIWQQPKSEPRPKELRSLRDLAGAASAFSDGWDEEEET